MNARADRGGTPAGPGYGLLGILAMAQFVIALDVTVVNVALPSIAADLGGGDSPVEWVVGAYVLATGVLLLLGGRVTDVRGPRGPVLVGLLAFTAASLGAAVSPNLGMLIVCRVLQGASAALFTPAALSVVATVYVGERRTRALALWGAIASGGAGVGLFLGGLLTAAWGWRSVFLINVPIGAVALPLLMRLVGRTPARRHAGFDLSGAGLAMVAVASLLAALDAVGRYGWLDPWTVVPASLGIAFLLGFRRHVRRVEDPLIPPSIWHEAGVGSGVAVMFLATTVLAATLLLVTFLLQSPLEMSALDTGVALLPTVLALALASHLAGSLLTRWGPRRLCLAGMLLAGLGALLLSRADEAAQYTALLPAFLVLGFGVGLAFPAITTAAVGGVARERAGIASGLLMTAHDLGGAFGVVTVTSAALTAGTLTTVGGIQRGFVAVVVLALAAAVVGGFTLPRTVPASTRISTAHGVPLIPADDSHHS